jgi:hypothetical protein
MSTLQRQMKLSSIQHVCLLLLLSSLCAANASILPAGEYGMEGRYLGSVLCQDCAGIWTEITLIDTGPDWGSGNGTFVMIERFTGGVHGGATVLSQGDWSAVDWVKGADYTGTIELRPEKNGGSSATPRYLFCDHGRSLRILNRDKSSISTLRPVKLERFIPAPEPHFLMTDADAGTTVYARVGDTIILALPVASMATYRTAWTMKGPAAQCVTIYSITGSGNGNAFSSDFTLKAAAPGKVHLEFQSAAQPSRSIGYEFEVQP